MTKLFSALLLSILLVGCDSSEDKTSDDNEIDPLYFTTPMPPLSIGDLDPNQPPSENFDLSAWKLNIPLDVDNDGRSDDIHEPELSTGYSSEFLYTADDGGMVFRSPIEGTTTSSNSSYVRVELREMLRRGDTSIDTRGVNLNNWVFSSAPMSDQESAAAVDGKLRVTMAVNHVTTTGASVQQGRIIIGQIHAENDEPIRLYYLKRPDNDKGSIYFAHELVGGQDIYYEMIGESHSTAPNPEDGIALNEVFSYEIDAKGNVLTVTIMRDGKHNVTEVIDMTESEYDIGGDFMYFKAGVYNLNNTGEPDDYSQATFYALEATHYQQQ